MPPLDSAGFLTSYKGAWHLPLHSFIERAPGTGVRNPRATAAAKTIVVFLISIGYSSAGAHLSAGSTNYESAHMALLRSEAGPLPYQNQHSHCTIKYRRSKRKEESDG